MSPEYHERLESIAAIHFLPFFRDLSDICDEAAWDEYARARLRQVKRNTLKKELSAGRRFTRWAKRERYTEHLPAIDTPTGAGVEHEQGRRRQVRVNLTPEDVEAILAELPERSNRGQHPVRAFFTVMWETGLRRATLWRLRVEDIDFRAGTLRIRPEADKARYGRELPLSPRALEALREAAPQLGVIFPKSDLRDGLRAAAVRAGVPNGQHVSNHDLRHARLTDWGSRTTDVAAFQFLAGHKNLSTTSEYVHPSRKTAEQLVRGRDTAGIRAGYRSGRAKKRKGE